MTMIVVGSYGLNHLNRLQGRQALRTANDLDMIGSLTQIHDWATRNQKYIEYMIPTSPWKFKCLLKCGRRVELEIAEVNPSSQMLWDMRDTFTPMHITLCIDDGVPVDTTGHVPPIEYLYLMKRSHVYWQVHWQKTISDLTYMKPYCGNFLREHVDFFNARLAENEAKFGKRFEARLNQSNAQFFAKSERALKRVYEHDDLHDIVKYHDTPMYQVLKNDPSKAWIDKQLFERQSHENKLRTVREEAMVIALERYVIPGKETDPLKAYGRALMRICTNLTSGWFREFAIDHWGEIQTPDVDYVELFEAANAS
jgi:hypothetical protein